MIQAARHSGSDQSPVPFNAGNLTVPTAPMAWPADRLERIGISSFGIGGTNVHVSAIVRAGLYDRVSSASRVSFANIIMGL